MRIWTLVALAAAAGLAVWRARESSQRRLAEVWASQTDTLN